MFHSGLLKLVSGGQTGADLGALDFALHFKIAHGGWCPKGRLNENGVIPSIYNLREAPLKDPACRTTLNILDSDGTLICTFDKDLGPGTKLTHDLCILFNKPVLILNLKTQTEHNNLLIPNFLDHHKIKTLKVAGNRESQSPGIYKSTIKYLENSFKN